VRLAAATAAGIIAAPLSADAVSLIDAQTGEVRRTFFHPAGHIVRAVGLSPDGTRLLVVGSYVIQLWRLDVAESELAQSGLGGPW
jgi:hypothetical protein